MLSGQVCSQKCQYMLIEEVHVHLLHNINVLAVMQQLYSACNQKKTDHLSSLVVEIRLPHNLATCCQIPMVLDFSSCDVLEFMFSNDHDIVVKHVSLKQSEYVYIYICSVSYNVIMVSVVTTRWGT